MNRSHLLRAFVVAVVCLLASVAARAAVIVAPVFGEHMVLQRGMEVPVWGTAAPGEKVTVEFAGKKAEATADEQGEWKAMLPPLEVGNATTLSVSGGDAKPVVFEDVLVGDVWVCSGQSNMQWSVKQSRDPEKEIADAKHPNIRFFQVPLKTSLTPTKELEGKWQVVTPETVAPLTAVGYYFARELVAKQPDVPIGLIQNAWGGQPVESFMSDEAAKSDSDFQPLLERKAAAQTRPATGPSGKERPGDAPQWISNIYNKMVYPVIPFGIKGAIWYQGESNAGRAEQYRKLFPAMIRDWRKQWGQGDFPFLFVQLANYGNRRPNPPEPGPSEWAELREAQAMALDAVPNTGMAVIIDIGEHKDIHPKNKQDVGKRLAIAAQKVAYGKDDVVFSGPLYDAVQFQDGKARIKFKHADGLKTKDGGPPKGFAIAGEDKKFVWADAKIEDGEVIVWSDSVKQPASVRYGWADDPDNVNLYNAADLPASPFRTDDWEMVTKGKK